jgi:integrase
MSRTTSRQKSWEFPKFVVVDHDDVCREDWLSKKKPKGKHKPPHLCQQDNSRSCRWYVRRPFPTDRRDKRGFIVYIQPKRACEPRTPERAAQVAKEIEDQYNTVLEAKERPQTVGEYIERYLAAKKNSVARRTYEHDQDLYHRYVKKHRFAGKMLTEIGPTDVQDLIDDIQSAGSSPTMAKKLHVFLSSAFNQAVKWKRLDENPATGVIVPKAKRSEKISMSKAEVAAFLRVCRSNPEYLVFEFALETGMRPQEFLAITWKNLDLKTGKAKVVEAIATGFKGGGFEVKIPKTDASYRTIVISEDLAGRLHDHRSLQLQRIGELKDLAGSSPLLSHMKRKGVNFKKRMTVRKHAAETLRNFENTILFSPHRSDCLSHGLT